MENVFVTRNSFAEYVLVYPAYVGIRKFHGCIRWGAAWQKNRSTSRLSPRGNKYAKCLIEQECRELFGFYPRAGTAWYVNAKGKRTKVDIDFSP